MQPEILTIQTQYGDSSNLNARQQLHARFSVNQYGWHRWVLDQLSVLAGARILELACGPGALWVENSNRVPGDWRITLLDLSTGMICEARSRCPDFSFAVADTQAIPLANESVDAIIANHMLYHVPDRRRALAEMRRVLTPNGRLYAATNGKAHMGELNQLMARFGASLPASHESFSLENGRDQLGQCFTQVELRRYDDALIVTEAEPLVAYARSTQRLTSEGVNALRERVEQELAVRGSICITKDVGLFEAQ